MTSDKYKSNTIKNKKLNLNPQYYNSFLSKEPENENNFKESKISNLDTKNNSNFNIYPMTPNYNYVFSDSPKFNQLILKNNNYSISKINNTSITKNSSAIQGNKKNTIFKTNINELADINQNDSACENTNIKNIFISPNKKKFVGLNLNTNNNEIKSYNHKDNKDKNKIFNLQNIDNLLQGNIGNIKSPNYKKNNLTNYLESPFEVNKKNLSSNILKNEISNNSNFLLEKTQQIDFKINTKNNNTENNKQKYINLISIKNSLNNIKNFSELENLNNDKNNGNIFL